MPDDVAAYNPPGHRRALGAARVIIPMELRCSLLMTDGSPQFWPVVNMTDDHLEVRLPGSAFPATHNREPNARAGYGACLEHGCHDNANRREGGADGTVA